MKKLVATAPIQYMGRIYNSGEALPADDQKMTNAWLSSGTAKWQDGEKMESVGAHKETPTERADTAAGAAMRAAGFVLEDEAGNFVGADALMAQIDVYARKIASMGSCGQDEQTPAGIKKDGQTGQREADSEENNGTQELIPGHLDETQLSHMTKAQLAAMAEELGVDISGAKNNAERAKILASVEVFAPASEKTGTQ